jgi:hypothetical protein
MKRAADIVREHFPSDPPELTRVIAMVEHAQRDALEPVCEHCNNRGVIETGQMENGPGGWGYVTVDCECEK